MTCPSKENFNPPKSTCPVNKLNNGLRISLTSELTIWLNAAPNTTPTASSRALPLIANSLNSFHILDIIFYIAYYTYNTTEGDMDPLYDPELIASDQRQTLEF